MRPQPLLSVDDVETSSRWYQRLLGCESAHGGAEYDRLTRDGALVLQLHRWDVEHHHGPIGDPGKPRGNGVLLWFEIDDFDDAVARAGSLNAEVVLPRQHNPPDGDGGPNHWEIWLRDPTAKPSSWPARTARRTEVGSPSPPSPSLIKSGHADLRIRM